MPGALHETEIDFSKYFMPERLTPLYHTGSYAVLSPVQRRRYNQLHACYLNEQTIFFERVMARWILRDYLKATAPGALADGLRIFIAEEEQHSEMFRMLNRRCRPDVYSKQDFDFIRLSPPAWMGLGAWVRMARRFPLFLWVLLIQEERAKFYAQQFLADDSGLEPNFISAQRRHLADEVGHIQWDEQLLDHVWPRQGERWRKANARIFGWLMREYFLTPKRSGLRVGRVLVAEFPALQPRWPALRRDLLQLGDHPEFNRLAYSREVTPKSFARFDRWPEFHGLSRTLRAYTPMSPDAIGVARCENSPSR